MAFYDINGNEIIFSSGDAITPVPMSTVNAMLACAYTYIDACRTGSLRYGDGTGSHQVAGTISCSTFMRCVLQGIPFNDYLPANDSTTTKSGERWKFGYHMLGDDYFASDATATAKDIYDLYAQEGRAFPTDYRLNDALPGDLVCFGADIASIRHIGMFVYKDNEGNNYILDSNILSRNGTPAIRIHKEYDHSAELSNNPVGLVRPNLSEAKLIRETTPVTATDGTIYGTVLNGYAHFLLISANVTAGTAVSYGSMTFTPNNTGRDFRIIPVCVTDDTDTVLTYSGVTDIQCAMSRYIIDKSFGGDFVYKKGDSLYGISKIAGYIHSDGSIGTSVNDVITAHASLYILKFDISGYKSISIPVFKTTEGSGSVMTDESGIILWEHHEATLDTGSVITAKVPKSAKYLYVTISQSLTALDYEIILMRESSESGHGAIAKVNFLPYDSTLSETVKSSLCLCAIKTEIANNKLPFASGYLFHKLGSTDKSLYYGTTFRNVEKVGEVTFDPKNCLLAVSPTDGRVIATVRGNRGAIYVWDGQTTTTLFGNASLKPMGWLYNSGVDFIVDSNNVEHCIFAEYDGSASDKGGFYVWRGTYPYTSESDWETVFHMDFNYYNPTSTTITHFHQIRRDPWTNILYLTSGDQPLQLKWWYSTDYGATWTLLTDNADNGWEEHICRCINFIFTKDYIYWATDHGTNHCLNKVSRNSSTNIIDPSTRVKLADMPYGQATNTVCYVENPNGLFFFERIDSGYSGTEIHHQFYSFETGEMMDAGVLGLTNNSWGGHRGKCYTNYTNGQEPHPAMGFSVDTPCVFDIIGASTGLGTIFYDIDLI